MGLSHTPKVYFLGAFTSGGLQVRTGEGSLSILKEGSRKKFVRRVQQITFSAAYACRTGQEVLYITERAVFRLTEDGLVLTEIAPGVDLQQDILDQMEFVPQISPGLRCMDARLFRDAKMGLQL